MGCCICRPKVEVTEDPTVLFHTKTGRAALVFGFGGESLNGVCGGGILYVHENTLSYESTCSSRFCCKCLKQQWELSSIQSVNLVENGSEIILKLQIY